MVAPTLLEEAALSCYQPPASGADRGASEPGGAPCDCAGVLPACGTDACAADEQCDSQQCCMRAAACCADQEACCDVKERLCAPA